MVVAAVAVCQTVPATINDNIELINDTVGISISPASSEQINLRPGDSYDGSFRVRQTGRETNDVFAEISPYTAGSADYDSWDFETVKEHTKITNWLTINLDSDCSEGRRENGKIFFTMRPKEECHISYHIDVPADAFGGSQHAAVPDHRYRPGYYFAYLCNCIESSQKLAQK